MTSVQAKILVVENDIKTGDHYRLGKVCTNER